MRLDDEEWISKDLEMVRSFAYLRDRVSVGVGCNVGVTAKKITVG